jgi:hypothetical protein
VQIWAAVDESMVAGSAYRAEIRVPGLSEDVVPVILRRRETIPADAAPAGGEAKIRARPRSAKLAPKTSARPAVRRRSAGGQRPPV